MSETLLGVLNMPYDLFWSEDVVARSQHDAIRVDAAKEIQQLQTQVNELKQQSDIDIRFIQQYQKEVNVLKRQNTELMVSNERQIAALNEARGFISNGIEFGYIRMPDPDTPDPAHDTLPHIDRVLEQSRQTSLAGHDAEVIEKAVKKLTYKITEEDSYLENGQTVVDYRTVKVCRTDSLLDYTNQLRNQSKG